VKQFIFILAYFSFSSISIGQTSWSLYSDWFIPVNWAFEASPDGSQFASMQAPIFPDSSLMLLRSDSHNKLIANEILGVGCILDPTDAYIRFDQNNIDPLLFNQSYSWDSLYFQLGYVRQVDSILNNLENKEVLDTLFIRYYSFSTAGIDALSISPENQIAYLRKYNQTSKIAESYFKMDTLILSTKDATLQVGDSWKTRPFKIAVGQCIPASSNPIKNSMIGFTLDFKPQLPYSSGDTLANLTNQKVDLSNPHNYVVTNYVVDSNLAINQLPESKNGNNSLFKDKYSQFDSILGYKPGNLYTYHQYFLCGFLISPSVSIDDQNQTTSKIYPNPTQGRLNLNLPQLDLSCPIQVVNSTGQVFEVHPKSIHGHIELDLQNLAKGIYALQYHIKGKQKTRRITLH